MLNTSITTAHYDLADMKLRQGFLAPCSSPAKLEQQIQLLMPTMSIGYYTHLAHVWSSPLIV